MAETFTVTKAKYAGEKDNPHGGKLHKFYCSFVNEAGEVVSDVYWQRKSEQSPEGEQFYGRIEEREHEGKPSYRFYTEQQQNGRQNGAGGSSRAKNDKDDAWWYAKDRRISRAGMLQAVVSSGVAQNATGDPDEYVAAVNLLTDALLASLDERTPHPSDVDAGGGTPGTRTGGTADSSASTASASTGFASDKQKEFFRRLLTGDSNVKEGIVRYAETMETDRISKAIDAMNGDDPATANAAQKALKDLADEWAKKQSDTPYDPTA